MSDASFSEATMLASLRDIRLPAEALGGGFADVLVSVGVGAGLALLCVMVVRLFSIRKQTPPEPTLQDHVAATLALAEAERRVALLHLLRSHAPVRYAALATKLYRPGMIDLRDLEAEVARLA